jgi:hypothetical protein
VSVARPRIVIGGAFVVLTLFVPNFGCVQPSTTGDKESVDPVEESTRSATCRPPGDVDPVLSFPGSPCDWLLIRDSSGLRLRSLEADAGADRVGVFPEGCLEERCVFEGAQTRLGPLVVALQRSGASEMPAGVYLGVLDDDHLRFVDLWAGAGEPVHGDATELGPAFALAPHACHDVLALFVEPRFAIAGQGEPPSELRAREGGIAFEGSTLRATAVERDGCVALDLALP